MVVYILIMALLIIAELIYFIIADKCNIVDKPNQRSSHTKIVLRGGGIIFVFGAWIWGAFFGLAYPWFLAGLTLAAGVSFIDDIHSLPDSIRLFAHFIAMSLMFYQLGMFGSCPWWGVVLAFIICVGATNIYNFMDGINGITAAYSIAVLIPLLVLNSNLQFVDESLIAVTIISTVVFAFFNLRPKNKAKCFAGDVGSVGIAFILLFMLGHLILKTGDVTWLVFMAVYGVDGCLTICHRLMLHEHLGEAHRKHMYQIMSNELGMSHVIVSFIYMTVQLVISLAMVLLITNSVSAHWIYFITIIFALSFIYVIFMRKYYHLHEEYLSTLR